MILQVKECGAVGLPGLRTNFLWVGGVWGEGRWSFSGRGGVGSESPVWVKPFLSANSPRCVSVGSPYVTFGFPQFPVSV